MTDKEQRQAARKFAGVWTLRGDEKSDNQTFWLELLRKVYGVAEPASSVKFEKHVLVEDKTRYIDAYLPATHVLIEQKSHDVRLERSCRLGTPEKPTPYGQAKRYDDNLPISEKSRWIVVCNFQRFLVYDMERPGQPPEEILLESLHKDPHRLDFLVDSQASGPRDMARVSLNAGEVVAQLYDGLLKAYGKEDAETLRNLNQLCVRLVFCLYGEDAGLFGRCDSFRHYLERFSPRDYHAALRDLFAVLNTPVEERDPYMDKELAAFPYVNGGLFSGALLIPQFTEELKNLLERKASGEFDWSGISPAIFGAVFESTLNPESRRSGGMHYTPPENIHKVIDPLFLDGLRAELAEIRGQKGTKRKQRLKAFQAKLASLVFLDPACGSGNFLTETYICLREMENEVLAELFAGQPEIDLGDVIKVSVGQFRGIEVNDYAVSVARTALWIAESQMFRKTEDLLVGKGDFLPLKAYPGIVKGNALRMDWKSLLEPAPNGAGIYVIGNPPFIGARMMGAEQKADLLEVFGAKWRNLGNLDYVCGWFRKAAGYMRGTGIRTAFVATNSICQGGQVADLWKGLEQDFGVHLDFAHRTFRWDSESKGMAHVHCVVVGFSCADSTVPPFVFDGAERIECKHLNPYLLDAPDVFIESRQHPRCDVPEIGIGNKPIDGGFYLFTTEEKEEFLRREPSAERFFRPWYGSEEFINRRPRWCLWLGDCTPAELRSMPRCLERVAKVRDYRLASKSEGTRKLADRPTRFHVENMPQGNYILIPRVSSERRRYIPMGFMGLECLCSDAVHLIPGATLYHFGILTSSVHNAWTRAVCGRLKSDYRYSKDIVYNNFPWPEAGEGVRQRIAETAQGILDARARFPDSSLADLYAPLTMPVELKAAHLLNDHAVLVAYGLPANLPEPQIVAHLFRA